MLQWYYLAYFKEMKSPMELLWFDPELKPESPAGKLPTGIAYREHGADLISRTDWKPLSTHCIVYGKAGRETNHDDNDVGQLLIDGLGERLIIDPGKPDPIYPKDYFGEAQYNYYTRSSTGHNVLVIGHEEMVSEPGAEARGRIFSRPTCVEGWLCFLRWRLFCTISVLSSSVRSSTSSGLTEEMTLCLMAFSNRSCKERERYGRCVNASAHQSLPVGSPQIALSGERDRTEGS